MWVSRPLVRGGRGRGQAVLEDLGLLERLETSDAPSAVLAPPHHVLAASLVVGHAGGLPWRPAGSTLDPMFSNHALTTGPQRKRPNDTHSLCGNFVCDAGGGTRTPTPCGHEDLNLVHRLPIASVPRQTALFRPLAGTIWTPWTPWTFSRVFSRADLVHRIVGSPLTITVMGRLNRSLLVDDIDTRRGIAVAADRPPPGSQRAGSRARDRPPRRLPRWQLGRAISAYRRGQVARPRPAGGDRGSRVPRPQ
jgi:hypothetical protein